MFGLNDLTQPQDPLKAMQYLMNQQMPGMLPNMPQRTNYMGNIGQQKQQPAFPLIKPPIMGGNPPPPPAFTPQPGPPIVPGQGANRRTLRGR